MLRSYSSQLKRSLLLIIFCGFDWNVALFNRTKGRNDLQRRLMQNFLHASHRQCVSVYECTEHWALGCANLQSDTLFEFCLYAPRQCKWQLRQSSHSLRAGPHSFISGQCSQTEGILGKPRDGSGKGGGTLTESAREKGTLQRPPASLYDRRPWARCSTTPTTLALCHGLTITRTNINFIFTAPELYQDYSKTK